MTKTTNTPQMYIIPRRTAQEHHSTRNPWLKCESDSLLSHYKHMRVLYLRFISPQCFRIALPSPLPRNHCARWADLVERSTRRRACLLNHTIMRLKSSQENPSHPRRRRLNLCNSIAQKPSTSCGQIKQGGACARGPPWSPLDSAICYACLTSYFHV